MDRRSFLGLLGMSVAVGCCGRAVSSRNGAGGGGRLAMVVDLDRCASAGECTACVEACHRAHNVPAVAEPRHEVKWIWKEPFHRVFPEHASVAVTGWLAEAQVPIFCNHCENPPCVRVCPAGATWKRDDGIVMVDPHRCIGCRYCMAACPYGSRSFNWSDPREHIAAPTPDYPTRTRGVVEKCTFCEERLAENRPPACVEACKAGALVFGDLDEPGSLVRRALSDRFSLRRRPELGTEPRIYYVVGSGRGNRQDG